MFVASGASLEATVQAADILKEKTGQEVSIVHAPWIQPVSSETWAKITETAPSWIASVEDHYINGGIGTLLAEYLAESASSTRLLRLGVKDFGQSGSPKDNVQAYRLDAQSIAEDFQAHL